MTIWEILLFIIFKLIIFSYDLLFGWIYNLLTKPWERRKLHKKVLAKPCKPILAGDTQVTYKPVELEASPLIKEFKHADNKTMAEVWTWAVTRYRGKTVLGTREMLGEEEEVQHDGQVFKKYDLGDYSWITYGEADKIAESVGRGLMMIGQEADKPLCIFADTRAEWMLSAQACFKQSFPVVTLYTNLGVEAVVHGLNETKVDTIITSHELLPKFKQILKDTPYVKKIIYFENQIKETDTTGFREDVKIMSFSKIKMLGKTYKISNTIDDSKPPQAESTCIIMYTSGSTGTPKGVVVSHRNLVNAVNSYLFQFNNIAITAMDRFIAYLPLAHVLELIAENTMLVLGFGIGYSSPNTLTDKSTMIRTGGKGDAIVLKPTVMFAVPLVLERIYKGIQANVKKKCELFEKVFDYCVHYKIAATQRGEITPIMDKLIFKSITKLIGGRLRAIVTGGAPLCPTTHEYIRACMCCPILQGYGLTETAACVTVMGMDENSTGRVGPPCQGISIRIDNWEEGNYRVTDKQGPRGEIVIGGANVTEGYYKMSGKTAEDYFSDAGQRWFRSGDIGQMEEDGTLRVIDRKKDLVKLQSGEYVSLGKVESVLKTSCLVENICIYADSYRSSVVALLCADRINLDFLATKIGIVNKEFAEQCRDKVLIGAVLKELIQIGRQQNLAKFEVPSAVTLCPDIWTPEGGLVTTAFKLKRKPLQKFYQNYIDTMYGA